MRGGQTYIDGRWCSCDIGITPRGRLVVSKSPIPCHYVINVSRRVVSPGFIDILADNSANPERTFLTFEKYKLGDGVATALQMHGGATHAGDYYRHFSREKHYVNWGVSTKVMNLRYKYPALASRLKAIESSLEEGALGVSHSPEYHPDTTWEELLAYARLARKYERPLFLHTRYSCRDKELQGVDEAIRLSHLTGCRVHIDHLNSTGGTFHMPEALKRIREARTSARTRRTTKRIHRRPDGIQPRNDPRTGNECQPLPILRRNRTGHRKRKNRFRQAQADRRNEWYRYQI